MLVFILKATLAHLIADFVLQPKKWVEGRCNNLYKSKYLYLHTLCHLVLLTLFFYNSLRDYWLGIMAITCSHFVFDLTKSYFDKRYNELLLFSVDQMLHISIIALTAHCYFSSNSNVLLSAFSTPDALSILIALLLLAPVSLIFIKLFFQKWDISFVEKNRHEPESLKDAGKIIGIIERMLIVIFIVAEIYEGIGFLLAAKSIFRFGDLTNEKDKKLTEYILLGTLISFTLGILIGFGLKYALHNF